MRILIDGYSLLHHWTELAPEQPRHSASARDALLHRLQEYRDATHTPITVFFDGQGAPPGTPRAATNPDLEVLFSPAGRTADDLIERVAYRLHPYGDVLVVTDDRAERDTVAGFGGLVSSCRNFVQQVEDVLNSSSEDLRQYNRQERERYRRAGR